MSARKIHVIMNLDMKQSYWQISNWTYLQFPFKYRSRLWIPKIAYTLITLFYKIKPSLSMRSDMECSFPNYKETNQEISPKTKSSFEEFRVEQRVGGLRLNSILNQPHFWRRMLFYLMPRFTFVISSSWKTKLTVCVSVQAKPTALVAGGMLLYTSC